MRRSHQNGGVPKIGDTVSSGSNTVRMEFGVFGVLMTSFPFCRATLLLMDNVRF